MAKQAGWGPTNEEKIGEIDQSLSIGVALGGERTDTKEAEAYAEHMAGQEEKENEREEFENEQVRLVDLELNTELELEDHNDHEAEQEQFREVDQEKEREDQEPNHEGPAEEGLGSLEVTELVEELVEVYHDERQKELVDQALEHEDRQEHEAEQAQFQEVDQELEAATEDHEYAEQIEMVEENLQVEAAEQSVHEQFSGGAGAELYESPAEIEIADGSGWER